ncbi:hypothetical protein [Thermomonas carbonis]|uniref:ChaN family lipoprotein n=1 Tax=Thermomonas carbonis TaxID=1463158 RepID=A0A7G9SNV8_9GAMM|nr:hypothetical protein [Thermomonas carbonis]QNN69533.1 hypothetical protein H9L16_12760 [Thermomonas carbonis]GHB93730.1 hypothetical protein GCM10010080_00900 [Thermomonas carbonis]
MKKIAIAIVIGFGALAVHAAPAQRDASKNPADDFFKAFNAQPDTFAEYRFLTSPVVQQDEYARNLSTQMLATHLSFLGRPVDALQSFPYRGSNAPQSDLPVPSDWMTVPASDWIAVQADAYRVIMVNEAHHAPQTRVLTIALLQRLRAKGYTHLAVEALLNDGTDPMPGGYPVRKSGIYTREPIFAELLREAVRLGYALLPYEPNDQGEQTQQQRESGQARAIAAVLAENPTSKVLVHAGYAHIGEAQEGLPDDARPMAMELATMSGLALLTIDQTSTRSHEAGDIDTVGRRLATQFAVDVASVLVSIEGDNAWSNRPGLNDASVLLPATPTQVLRPDWLALEGKRQAVAIDLTGCLGHLPCLAEARHADEGDDAIPADQFLMLVAGEAATPLYLAPGRYRLRLLGADGATLSDQSLQVATRPTPPSARTP